MDFTDEEIMARLVHKLYRRANWGESLHHLRISKKDSIKEILVKKV